MNLSQIALARICGLYSGVVFGIYWLPLRALDHAGFPGLWSTTVFNIAAMVAVAPILFFYRKRLFPGRLRLHIILIGTGIGYVLYASAFLFTDVVSVIVLFYLMPIWGFIFGRIFLNDVITPIRWASIVIAFAGLWMILGEGSAVPLPRNAGDWMALAAGLTWAGMAVLLLKEGDTESAMTYGAGFLAWGLIFAAVIGAVVTQAGVHPPAQWSGLLNELKWMIPFSMIIIVPAAIATVYAPTKLNPGVVGLLFMTEISVGTITAAIWADELFGTRQLLGVILITIAGALEPLSEFRNRAA